VLVGDGDGVGAVSHMGHVAVNLVTFVLAQCCNASL